MEPTTILLFGLGIIVLILIPFIAYANPKDYENQEDLLFLDEDLEEGDRK